jgi:endonuclease/exonuclease/phosphatase family metal-dependent hydrolase
MTFNFQYTYSKWFSEGLFADKPNLVTTPENIQQAKKKYEELKKIVEQKSEETIAAFKKVQKQLEEKKAELMQSYEKQKIIVDQLAKEVTQLEQQKKREYDPVKKKLDQAQQKVSSLQNAPAALSQAAVAALNVAKKAVDAVARFNTLFNEKNVVLIAAKAKLALLNVGGELYTAALDPYQKAVEVIKDKGLQEVRTLPEYIEAKKWEHHVDLLRRELAIEMIERYKPDIICFQEGFYDMPVFSKRLPNYTLVYRDPHLKAADIKRFEKEVDINALMFKTQRFQLERQGFVWLNETQEPFKFGWGARGWRTATWVALKDTVTNNLLFVCNTHLDHRSQPARIEGARLLANIVKEQSGLNVGFLIGDFNINSIATVLPELFRTPFSMKNAQQIARSIVGPVHTFIPGAVIDYFIINNAQLVKVIRYEVIDFQRGGLTPSDHRAVIIDVEFTKNK